MRSGNPTHKRLSLLLLALSAMAYAPVRAQVSFADAEKRGSIYFSVGMNSPSHKTSDIDIVSGRPGSVSNYTLSGVAGDNSTTKTSGFPYNFRIGYFFDYFQNWAVELSYDPLKYHVSDGQIVKMTGQLDGRTIDSSFAFSPANGYFYNIDGANLLSVNIVRRIQLFQIKSHNLRIDALVRAGIGPCMPHIYNSLQGKVAEYPSFQLGGWNAGADGSLRITLMRHVFLEASYKYSYASYKDLGVYDGGASQKLVSSQVIFSLGYWFSTTKHNPLFMKPDNRKPPFAIKPIMPPDNQEDQRKTLEKAPEKTPPAEEAPAPAPVPDTPPDTPPDEPTPDMPPSPDAPVPEPGQ